MRRYVFIILGVLLVIGTYFIATKIIDSKNKPKPKVEKVVKTVYVKAVTNGTVPILIPSNGTITAKNKLELYAEYQGIFRGSSHDFKAGQEYKKGQTLISLDAGEFNASVLAAKSEFYNLVTSIMPDLRLDYPEVFPVWDSYLKNFDVNKRVPELPNIADEKASYFITGRGIQASYYNIKNLEQRLGKYNIYAPFTGVLTEALVNKGTLVRPGQKLGEFIDPSVYEVELAIEKEYSDLLKVGESVDLSASASDKIYVGKVSRVNGKIEQTSQTVKVFVEVKGDDLKEGMFLEAQLDARSEESAISVNRKLLIDESQLFIVKDSVLELIDVQPVYFSAKQVVLKNIPDGTTILAQPISGAYAGMLVKTIDESAKQAKTTSKN
ncbi:efflux RND transporter periplasmic adaptor subunit [Patiriisocius marinus]|uniref:Multidrug efflux pump subunit AcrA (Membrane-fusion protein) n=1 Tax=Patiriisocius marinus TaxID=1397112 RepID=A0A5J4J100_9FLAO|nr:HlyD family efflux transporter periplasmic adaptor subunit [Patiriisocius marinus]GER58147.1 hypothetical protein ULMA_02550 [Patiriisocius marinus]